MECSDPACSTATLNQLGGPIVAMVQPSTEEQKPGSGIKGKGFPQLLDDPQARGVFGDVEVPNASAFVADDEEAMEYAERDRRNRKEIHRRWLPCDYKER
jgi:hypothetical protein